MKRIGIANENEFYSQHYLSEIFTGDVLTNVCSPNFRMTRTCPKPTFRLRA